MKNSPLLTQLIELSQNIGDKKSSLFTAERFIVALIDKISTLEEKTSDELVVAEFIVRKAFNNIDFARKQLIEYINSDSGKPYNDSCIYIKKRLMELEASDLQELDTVVLLLAIVKNPNDTVRAVMDPTVLGDAEVCKKIGEELDAETAAAFERWVKASMARDGEDVEAEEPSEETVCVEDVDEPAKVKTEMSELVCEVRRIRKQLSASVYGQDNAVNVFVTGYFQARMLSMIDKSRKRPRATFLFAGPPGVGKTFLAERAAASLGLPFRRFDMSEYADKEANIEFCGSDKVYKNAKAGNVTSFVAENPVCVLLFDEIEKANICVIHLFLQMLDAGRLRDNFTDEEVSFSNTIIILTTNAGKQLYEDSESGDFSAVSRKVIIKALQKDINPTTGTPYFPGAICSRFASGNVVMFNHISAANLREIAKKEIERHAKNLKKETGIEFYADEQVYTALLFSEGSSADARTIRSRAETFFNDELYELLRLIASEKVNTGIDDIEKIHIGVDLGCAEGDIKKLFNAETKPCVLVLANESTAALCRTKVPGIDFECVYDAESAIAATKSRSIDFVLLDMKYGAPVGSLENLNIEDADSPARDFFRFLKEHKSSVPVYLIEEADARLGEEERISFARQGVRGVVEIERNNNSFAAQLEAIASSMHQQASMLMLAKANKIVNFETAQTVSSDGKHAEIRLFDFEMSVAVDSEDSKNVLSAVSRPDVHFDDVIGAGDAKKELTYFVEYLRNPKKYIGTGVKAPKGIILYGPPGTGKTMLAKAMACEAGVTFIAAEGNQFLTKYTGEGSEKVHELFKTARKYAPSILFVDEIDAIAKERRGGVNSGSNGEDTLTAFLTEMDGFASDSARPVFVLAATNFDVNPGSDKSLDAALMRRFDRRVYIDLPGKDDRIKFLKKKIAGNGALDISEEQVENIAVRSTGMSLAELDSAVELALRSAIREGSTVVNDAILEEAFETFNSGEVKKWDESQLERVARHEAGHALLCCLGGETPSYLTVVARGNHGGYMQRTENEGKAIYTKDELLARIRTSLGGRAAEIVYYGERDGISTGASGDLISATNTARQIVCTYGMDEDFGLAVVAGTEAVSGIMPAEIREYVNRILREQMSNAVRLISENRDKIDSLVEALMVKNHLNGAEIERIVMGRKSDSDKD